VTQEIISSSSNPLLKRYRKLKTGKHRDRERATVVEGIAPVWQAFDHADVETILVAPDLLRSEDAKKLVARARTAGEAVVELTREAFESIADRDNPSGLAAIVRTKDHPVSDLTVGNESLFAVVADVASPGNLGTIVRTADAVGAGVVVTGESTDPWHPACVKASMGTAFTAPIATAVDIRDVIAWCKASGITVVTTSAHAKTEHWDATYELPAAIVLGSERHGLQPDVLEQGDVQIRIPMGGKASSLNLAVAGGILLYEARRLRK
jgi:RNA methyltransferase, TrmH family